MIAIPLRNLEALQRGPALITQGSTIDLPAHFDMVHGGVTDAKLWIVEVAIEEPRSIFGIYEDLWAFVVYADVLHLLAATP